MQNRPRKCGFALQVRLFGTLGLLRGDGGPVVLSGRKDRALMAYLVAHAGDTLARDRLVELFWPDAAEGAGRASLRQSLSTIRKALGKTAGALIDGDRDTVTLHAEGLVTDVAVLEHLAAQPGCSQPVPSGDFLEGLTGISPAFDTWQATEQARLSALACKVLAEAAMRAESERRFADAAALLTRALAIDPLAEATHRRLMEMYAAQNRTDAALRQFRTLERLLETELGVRPEKQTLDLARDIRKRRQAASAPSLEARAKESRLPSSNPPPAFDASFGLDLSLPEKPSIAVLPFANMSSDPEQEYFSDGISEDIITALSKVDDLLVVARNSTFVYKGKAVDMKRVSEEQGVRYVLEGSVRKAGNRVRVSAQLTDATTGHHVWAERYDRELADIFAVQDEIMREVVTALDARLRGGHQISSWSSGTRNIEAWECVRRGMDALNSVTAEGDSEAIKMFVKASEIDPDYPMAWVGIGWWKFHRAEGWNDADKAEREEKLRWAEDCARKAFGLDPSCPDAYALLGLCRLTKRDYDRAIEASEKAIALAPNVSGNLATTAAVLNKAGRPQRAFELIKRAMRLSPIYPGWYLYVLATSCRLLARAEDAVIVFEEAIRRNPESLGLHVGLASALGELGRIDEARKTVVAILGLRPEFSIGDYVSELSYRDPAELERFEDGLRSVGLPE